MLFCSRLARRDLQYTQGELSPQLNLCNLLFQTLALHHSEDFNPMNVKHAAGREGDAGAHITIAMTGSLRRKSEE